MEVSVWPSRPSKPGKMLDWEDDQGNKFNGLAQSAIQHFAQIHHDKPVAIYMEPRNNLLN